MLSFQLWGNPLTNWSALQKQLLTSRANAKWICRWRQASRLQFPAFYGAAGKGYDAVSYTGWQARIRTEAVHGNARITDIDTSVLGDQLEQGKIVIVAGFQGMTEDCEITTLGRGGSDTTAVALVAALKADKCDIYTDVPGVFTTDPRYVKSARKLAGISYDEMLELANLGAGVLHPRAVEFAKITKCR